MGCRSSRRLRRTDGPPRLLAPSCSVRFAAIASTLPAGATPRQAGRLAGHANASGRRDACAVAHARGVTARPRPRRPATARRRGRHARRRQQIVLRYEVAQRDRRPAEQVPPESWRGKPGPAEAATPQPPAMSRRALPSNRGMRSGARVRTTARARGGTFVRAVPAYRAKVSPESFVCFIPELDGCARQQPSQPPADGAGAGPSRKDAGPRGAHPPRRRAPRWPARHWSVASAHGRERHDRLPLARSAGSARGMRVSHGASRRASS